MTPQERRKAIQKYNEGYAIGIQGKPKPFQVMTNKAFNRGYSDGYNGLPKDYSFITG